MSQHMPQQMSSDSVEDRLRALLGDVLGLGARAQSLDASSPLFGALPELDSMAVAEVLTEIEDRFGIVIDDDDVSAEVFDTFGHLASFVTQKLRQRS